MFFILSCAVCSFYFVCDFFFFYCAFFFFNFLGTLAQLLLMRENTSERIKKKKKSFSQYSKLFTDYHKRPNTCSEYFRFSKPFFLCILYYFSLRRAQYVFFFSLISELISPQANYFVVEHSFSFRSQSIPRAVFDKRCEHLNTLPLRAGQIFFHTVRHPHRWNCPSANSM